MALVGHISGSNQSNSVIGISGSVIVANRPQALFPAMPGTDVTFFVSGSSTERSVFGGDLISSSSFNLKSGTGGASQFSVSTTGMLINSAAGVNTINIAASTGNITTSGDIAVNGGDVTTTSATATLFNTTATNISIGSAGTAILIGAATGAGTTTVNNSLTVKGTNNNVDMLNITGSAGLSVTKNVVISGDLTVNGSMNTVNTTNLEIKDSVIGLGFASGTIAQTAGDRGWIGGISGANNVMEKWDNTASEFVFARTTSSATGSFGIASYANLHANDIQARIVTASLGFSGSLTKLADGTSYIIGGTNITVTTGSNGAITIDGSASGAPANAQYLVLSANGTLTDERIFTTGTGLKFTDGGAGGNYTLVIDDSVVATVSGTTFQGTIKPSTNNFYDLGSTGARWYRGYIDQISGSHTQLADGTSAFIAGTNVTIVTGSNGAVTISASSPAVDDFFDSTTNGAIFTTGSAAFRGTDSSIDAPSDVGSNVFFFVSGSRGSLGAVGVNDSVFGGNLVVSGTLKVGTNGLEVASIPGVVTYLDAKTFLNVSANGNGVDVNDSGLIRLLSANGVRIGASFNNVNVGADTSFYVSGTIGGRGATTDKISVFGGNLVTSGTVYAFTGLTGSHTRLIDGTAAFIGGAGISISTGSNGAITFAATSGGGDVFGPASATDGAVALFDTGTGKLLKNSLLTSNAATDALFIAGNLGVSGSISLGDATSDTVSFTARVNTNVLPSADMTYELGSSQFRWAHVYTGDLHLRNDRGDYTLIEEEDFLSIRFNKTGKRYKFVLEAVPELDEDPIVR